MKKILLLIDNLDSGGAQNQMVLLAQGLKGRGYQPIVVSYFRGTSFYAPALLGHDIRHVVIEKKDKLGFGFLYQLRRFIKKEGCQRCISFMNTPNSYLALCKAVLGMNIQIIISHRMHTDLNNMNKIRKGLLKWVNSQADSIICNSHHERINWITHQSSISNKIQTIYNGIDPARFDKPKQLRQRSGELLVVGSLSHFKNGLVILEALRQLRDSGQSPFKLIWVGRVDTHLKKRSAYAQAMFDFVHAHELQDWISFVDPSYNIVSYYHNHDALVLASKSEGLPNVVCEALSTGMPVILSNVLDHPKLVEEGKEGFLFDPNRPESLTGAILKFYSLDDSEYSEMQLSAYKKSLQLFSLEKYLDSYVTTIES